jgi:hypothetical protein
VHAGRHFSGRGTAQPGLRSAERKHKQKNECRQESVKARLVLRALRPLIRQRHRQPRPQQRDAAVAAPAKQPVAARKRGGGVLLEKQVEPVWGAGWVLGQVCLGAGLFPC